MWSSEVLAGETQTEAVNETTGLTSKDIAECTKSVQHFETQKGKKRSRSTAQQHKFTV